MCAIDIARGRDSGTSNYLQARQFYLNDSINVEDALNGCDNKQAILDVYNHILEDVDALVGVLCESP